MSAVFQNPETARKILRNYRTVAVVGLSDNPARPSHQVAAYLQEQNFKIVPVNPRIPEALGEKAYPDLLSIPFDIEVVDIFRRGEETPMIIDQAIQKGARAVWLQEGVISELAAGKARSAGLDVIMDLCMLKEHVRLSQT